MWNIHLGILLLYSTWKIHVGISSTQINLRENSAWEFHLHRHMNTQTHKHTHTHSHTDQYTHCAWAGGTFFHCLRKVLPAHVRQVYSGMDVLCAIVSDLLLQGEIVFGATYELRVKCKMECMNRFSEGRNDRQMTPRGYPNFNFYVKNLRVL
jgi:hypothetical protein